MLPPVTAERQTYCSPVYISNGHLAGFTLWSPGESTGDRKIFNKMRSASAAGSSAIPVLCIRTNSYIYTYIYIYIYIYIYMCVCVGGWICGRAGRGGGTY